MFPWMEFGIPLRPPYVAWSRAYDMPEISDWRAWIQSFSICNQIKKPLDCAGIGMFSREQPPLNFQSFC